MKSEDKLKIDIKSMPKWNNKLWVIVKLAEWQKSEWIPSFEDLYRIVKAIGDCEDKKYPNGKGHIMVTHFLVDTLESGLSFEELAIKYKIPNRNGLK